MSGHAHYVTVAPADAAIFIKRGWMHEFEEPLIDSDGFLELRCPKVENGAVLELEDVLAEHHVPFLGYHPPDDTDVNAGLQACDGQTFWDVETMIGSTVPWVPVAKNVGVNADDMGRAMRYWEIRDRAMARMKARR